MNLIKKHLDERPALKRLFHYLIMPSGQARPRRWVKWFVNPMVHRRGAGATVRRRTRCDVFPFRAFDLGAGATVEDFATINNGVGDVRIGEHTRIGIGNVIIGPVAIGQRVILAQNVVMSGLNHSYEDPHLAIMDQPVTVSPIVIEDECWIGANAVVTAGVTVGRHAVVAGGSVVTRDVPPYTVVAGNPARVIKHYDAEKGTWVRATRPENSTSD